MQERQRIGMTRSFVCVTAPDGAILSPVPSVDGNHYSGRPRFAAALFLLEITEKARASSATRIQSLAEPPITPFRVRFRSLALFSSYQMANFFDVDATLLSGSRVSCFIRSAGHCKDVR